METMNSKQVNEYTNVKKKKETHCYSICFENVFCKIVCLGSNLGYIYPRIDLCVQLDLRLFVLLLEGFISFVLKDSLSLLSGGFSECFSSLPN